jgi:hypothetical protein
VGLNPFILTHVYSTISLSCVSPSLHRYAPPPTKAFLLFLWTLSKIICRLCGFLPVPRTFVPSPLSLFRGLSFCVGAMNLFFCSYSRDPHPFSQLAICFYSRNPCQAHAMTLCSSFQGRSSMFAPSAILSL